MPDSLSRRSALRLMGGAAAALAFDLPTLCVHAQEIAKGRSPYFFLTQDEAAVLRVLVDRLIPADDFPSASEAGVIDFIDFQLATDWGKGEGLYLDGPFFEGEPGQGYQLPYTPAQLYRRALAGIDANRIRDMRDEDVDEFLKQLEAGKAELNGIPGSWFFELLQQNTNEGYFADPVYNGNRNHAGWRMVGFPGADAYYITEVDRYNMVYLREPTGVAHRRGIRDVAFTARDISDLSETTALQVPGG